MSPTLFQLIFGASQILLSKIFIINAMERFLAGYAMLGGARRARNAAVI